MEHGIRNISFNIYPNAGGLVPLSVLDSSIRDHGVDNFGTEQELAEFLAFYPKKFEVVCKDGSTYVRNVRSARQDCIGGTGTQPKAAPARKATRHDEAGGTEARENVTRSLTLHDIRDFAFFGDYEGMLRQLAAMAESDGWAVLEGGIRPYYVVDLLLRCNFALAVEQCRQGDSGRLTVGLERASFDTGFHTAEGSGIVARFSVNLQRDSNRFQSYIFERLTAGDEA